jgi:prepilin peptidase CpaA
MPIFLLPLVAAALRMASVLALATAAASDIDDRIISNRTSLVTLGIGVIMRLVLQPQAFAASVFAAAAVYLGLAGLAHLKLLGGGDVKLAAAASFFVPPIEVPALLIDIALTGGVLCLAFLVERGTKRGTPVPYGVAISAATAYRVIVDLWP